MPSVLQAKSALPKMDVGVSLPHVSAFPENINTITSEMLLAKIANFLLVIVYRGRQLNLDHLVTTHGHCWLNQQHHALFIRGR